MAKPKKERVEIKTPIRTGGAVKNKELPFKMLVMAPLSGQRRPKIARPQLISKDKKNDVNSLIKKVRPELEIEVENRLQDQTELASGGLPTGKVKLKMVLENMDDLSPKGIEKQLAAQVPQFREKLELLRKLEQFSSQLDNNADLENFDRYAEDPDIREFLKQMKRSGE